MSLHKFLNKVRAGEAISFNECMVIITENYHYQATEFSNGLGEDIVVNPAGKNEGSCKIFAFAKLNGLDKEQTLSLFGDYYRHDVLPKPNGDNHQNIRAFMRYGWEGIEFKGEALAPIVRNR